MQGLKEKNVVFNRNSDSGSSQYWKVILYNSDFKYDHDFFGDIAEVFKVPYIEASNLMTLIEKEGSAVCGIYLKEVAELKLDLLKNLMYKAVMELA